MNGFNEDQLASNPLDPKDFRRQGHIVIDFLADYFRDIKKYPILSQVEQGYLRKSLPKSAPYEPEPFETILQDVQAHIVPDIIHWQSPNFSRNLIWNFLRQKHDF